MPKTKKMAICAHCDIDASERICQHLDGKPGKNCPTLVHKQIVKKTLEEYKKPKLRKFAKAASIQEAECYGADPEAPGVFTPQNPRIVEICQFAQKMGYKRLGIAFCSGSAAEARIVTEILEFNGFEVASVICKAGQIPKEEVGMADEEKIMPGTFESMCNPINQAMVLNEAKTDFNVVINLCVGHDSLFFKYSKAPVTVFSAKDRVTGHNPMAAIYTAHSYYSKLLKKKVTK